MSPSQKLPHAAGGSGGSAASTGGAAHASPSDACDTPPVPFCRSAAASKFQSELLPDSEGGSGVGRLANPTTDDKEEQEQTPEGLQPPTARTGGEPPPAYGKA